MSEQTYAIPDEQADDSDEFRRLRDHAKQLEADLKTTKKNEADAATLAKENAFLKAGVDLEDPVAKMLFNSYDGELDTEAVKAAAVAVRLTPGEPTPAAGSTPTEPVDTSQTTERNALANDTGGAVQLPAEDPIQAGYKEFYDGLARGQSREDASVAVIGRVIAAAEEGDPRFRFDANAWTAQEEAKSR